MGRSIFGSNACSHVLGTVREYLLALLGGKRPATDDAIAHRVLTLGGDAADAEILQRPDQALVLSGNSLAVHVTFEFWTQVENIPRERPAERQVARHFRVRDKADDQRIWSRVVWRPIAELVPPQPSGLPGAQIVKHHIRPLSWPRNELEIPQA
jgi:hypothetical protein